MQKATKNVLFITTLAGLLSCQKKDNTPVTAEEVVFSITSPLEGQTYQQGDTVDILGDISYISQLHGYITRIITQDGTVVYENEGHTHSDKLKISEKWVNTLNKNTPLKLEVTTIINHTEDKKTVNVDFYSQP